MDGVELLTTPISSRRVKVSTIPTGSCREKEVPKYVKYTEHRAPTIIGKMIVLKAINTVLTHIIN